MLIKRVSSISGVEHQKNIPVEPQDFLSWEGGLGSIDELMPYLNDDDRDFILSGITKEEWNDAFSELVG